MLLNGCCGTNHGCFDMVKTNKQKTNLFQNTNKKQRAISNGKNSEQIKKREKKQTKPNQNKTNLLEKSHILIREMMLNL